MRQTQNDANFGDLKRVNTKEKLSVEHRTNRITSFEFTKKYTLPPQWLRVLYI